MKLEQFLIKARANAYAEKIFYQGEEIYRLDYQ